MIREAGGCVSLGVVRDLRAPRSLDTPDAAEAYHIAGGTGPVSRSYIQAAVRQLGITAQNLRADRLHDEAEASGGDPLQLTQLFGISDPTAIRYCAEAGIPSQDMR